MARGRKPSVRYWASRKGGGYFATIKGQQVELALGPDDFPDGPTYKRAVQKFTDLGDGNTSGEHTVETLYKKYRAHLGARKETLRQFKTHAGSFVEHAGTTKIPALQPFHITEWLQSKDTWGETTRHHAVNYVQMMLNWAVKEGHIRINPLAGRVTVPEARVRGREARMSQELMDLIEKALRCPRVGLVLRCLRATGARPIELFKAKIRHLQGNIIVLPWNPPAHEYRWKNAKKTKKDRTICLPPDIADELRTLAEGRDRTGPLLPTPRRCHWTQSNFAYHWHLIRSNPEVRAYFTEHNIDENNVIPYAYRHTFASDWLDTGRSIQVLARLMGTSVHMIERVYGHPDQQKLYDMYLDYVKH